MTTKKTSEGPVPAEVVPSPSVESVTKQPSPKKSLLALRSWLVPLGGLVLLALLPLIFDQVFVADDGTSSAGLQLHRLTLISIFVIAALAQNILTGYAAQPSLGNAAFFGVGAYMLAWITNDLNQPYLVGIIVALLVCAVLGIIVGGPALRISGAYLAIVTLGLVSVTGSLLDLWDTTAGRQNYELNTLPDLLTDDHSLYFTVLLVVATIIFFGYHLLRSRVGRAWIAIRDNEAAAEAFGVDLTWYKLLAFVVSAVLTGLAGALYATWASTATATMSSADQTIAFLAMIVVGGLGSIVGSVLGALFVGFLPILLGQLPNTVAVGPMQLQVSTLTTGLYGLLLLLALIFFPTGLSSFIDRGRVWVARFAGRGAQR